MDEKKEGWKIYERKKVFIKLKNNREYSGKVLIVDTSFLPLIWITILDKFGKKVTLLQTEISVIEEARE